MSSFNTANSISDTGSISDWITRLERHETVAIEKLWHRYYDRLIGLAKLKLRSFIRRVADEEDVVQDTLNSFLMSNSNGNYAHVRDRNDLWKLLVTILDNKAKDQVKHECRQKRGSGRVRGNSLLGRPGESSPASGFDNLEHTGMDPETNAIMLERVDCLLARLDDPSLRQVALLKLDGYTNDEIAESLQRTTRAIERKLQKIRALWADDAND